MVKTKSGARVLLYFNGVRLEGVRNGKRKAKAEGVNYLQNAREKTGRSPRMDHTDTPHAHTIYFSNSYNCFFTLSKVLLTRLFCKKNKLYSALRTSQSRFLCSNNIKSSLQQQQQQPRDK